VSRRNVVKTFSGEHGRLEDLFRFDERLSPMPVEQPAPNRWLWQGLGATFIISLVVLMALRVIGYAAPILLVLMVCAGVVAVRMLVRTVAERRWRRVGDLVRGASGTGLISPGGWTLSSDDGMLQAIRRWDRRLEWGATNPARYAHTVAPQLGELADQWLRQRHGLTRASDPDRARAMLGESTWATLHPAAGVVPSMREIFDALQRLESA
jgi:hypothetical protein